MGEKVDSLDFNQMAVRIEECKLLAEKNELPFMAYLLELAHKELQMSADDEHIRSAPKH